MGLTVIGEFFVPALLSRRDPDYRPGVMAVSVLGRTGDPAARIYNAWLIWLGLFLLTAAPVYYKAAAPLYTAHGAGSSDRITPLFQYKSYNTSPLLQNIITFWSFTWKKSR